MTTYCEIVSLENIISTVKDNIKLPFIRHFVIELKDNYNLVISTGYHTDYVSICLKHNNTFAVEGKPLMARVSYALFLDLIGAISNADSSNYNSIWNNYYNYYFKK